MLVPALRILAMRDLESELPSPSLFLKRILQGSRRVWNPSPYLLDQRWIHPDLFTYLRWLRTVNVPSSLVHGCLFNIFAANLHIYRPFGYPPPADAPHSRC